MSYADLTASMEASIPGAPQYQPAYADNSHGWGGISQWPGPTAHHQIDEAKDDAGDGYDASNPYNLQHHQNNYHQQQHAYQHEAEAEGEQAEEVDAYAVEESAGQAYQHTQQPYQHVSGYDAALPEYPQLPQKRADEPHFDPAHTHRPGHHHHPAGAPAVQVNAYNDAAKDRKEQQYAGRSYAQYVHEQQQEGPAVTEHEAATYVHVGVSGQGMATGHKQQVKSQITTHSTYPEVPLFAAYPAVPQHQPVHQQHQRYHQPQQQQQPEPPAGSLFGQWAPTHQAPPSPPRQQPPAAAHMRSAYGAATAAKPQYPAVPGGRSDAYQEAHSRHGQGNVHVSPLRPVGAGGTSGKVVHLKRSEAWARFLAYEGCLQVCLSQVHNQFAQQLLSDGINTLREGFGVGELLLRGVSHGTDVSNDICWDDTEPTDRALNAVAFASSTSYLKIRPVKVVLPGQGLLGRMFGRRNTGFKSGSGDTACELVVYCAGSDGVQLGSPMNSRGVAPLHGQSIMLTAEQQCGELKLCVVGHDVTLAAGSLQYADLWKLGQQAQVVDEGADEAGAGEVSTMVQIYGIPQHQGKAGSITLVVQRVRKDVHKYELGLEATGKADTMNKHTMRVGGCLAYDCVLEAALASLQSGRQALSLQQTAWDWLLTSFAQHFGVRSFYCLLAYLRWVLSPRIRSCSVACLSTIQGNIQVLLDSQTAGLLTSQEATLLKRTSRETEQVLETAFENYFRLDGSDEQSDGLLRNWENVDLSTYNPNALQAAMNLFHVMKDIFTPSDQDWINARFRIAAKKRWSHHACSVGAGGGGNPDDAFDSQSAGDAAASQAPSTQQHGHASSGGGNARSGMASKQPMANGSSPLQDNWAGRRRPYAARPGTELKAGTVQNSAHYKRLEYISGVITKDLRFDLGLQRMAELLPSSVNLPGLTCEEYCARFVSMLRDMLERAPPTEPSIAAVDLLVAVSNLQGFLQEEGLTLPREHPGHLDATELFHKHVLGWITNSQEELCECCRRLEADSRAAAAAGLARVHAEDMPGLMEGVDGDVAPLVSTMIDRAGTELEMYMRVVKYWPLFGPHVEAAMCKVVRSMLAALQRLCHDANSATMAGGSGSSAGNLHAANSAPSAMALPVSAQQQQQHNHRRTVSAQVLAPLAHNRMGHMRAASHMPAPVPTVLGRIDSNGSSVAGPSAPPQDMAGPLAAMRQGLHRAYPGAPSMGGYAAPPAMMMGGPQQYPAGSGGGGVRSLAVLVREAVLLNSLKCLMVMVPRIEDTICKWCGGSAMPQSRLGGRMDPSCEDMPPYIGAQFAQVVKELRTEYASAVAACAGRLADTLRAHPSTNLKAALSRPKPSMDMYMHAAIPNSGGNGSSTTTPNYAHVSSATAQREFVEGLMAPIRAAAEEAVGALRGALDPRVFVATVRALWDGLGRDLYEFVDRLQEGNDNRGAWRARQHAATALALLNAFFQEQLTLPCHGLDEDLAHPAHVEKAERLLAQSGPTANINFSPF